MQLQSFFKHTLPLVPHKERFFSQCPLAHTSQPTYMRTIALCATVPMQLHYVYARCATAMATTATTTATGHKACCHLCLLCNFRNLNASQKLQLGVLPCVLHLQLPLALPLPPPCLFFSLSLPLRLFLCVSPSGNGRPAANCRAAQLCISLHIFEPEESEGKVAGGEDRCVWGFWGLHI